MAGITQSTALWYASRATGVVSLLMLSLVLILGMLVNRQGKLPGLPAFAVTGLHRSLSLLSVVFVAVHVLTAILDPYVTIRLISVIIPFTSGYLPFWLGLGAVALDLMLALIVTSLIRARLSRRVWRGVHWLAYAAWPIALIHGLGASPDLRGGGLRLLAIGSALAVGGALLWRTGRAMRDVPRAERAAAVFTAERHRGGGLPGRTPPADGGPGAAGRARESALADGGAR
jgi:methionine sulfoxide reductase heme-binding subunit